MPDYKFCMDCGKQLQPSNKSGVCQSCKRESNAGFIPSQTRIKRMCEMFKRRNMQRDMQRGDPKIRHVAVEDFTEDDFEGDD